MSDLLFHYYNISPTTWVYVSSLLMIGLYFKFGRLWSVRNLDLLLLILLAPGMLLVVYGEEQQAIAPLLLDVVTDDEAHQGDENSTLSAASVAEAPSGGATITVPLSNDPLPKTTAPSEPPLDSAAVVEPTSGVAAPGNDGAETPPADEALAAKDDTPLAPLEPGAAPAPLRENTSPGASSGTMLEGRSISYYGYLLLFFVSSFLLLRLLIDPTMIRRPLLEPNLTSGGLIFLSCAMFLFLMANIVNSTPTEADLKGPRSAHQLLQRQSSESPEAARRLGPGNAILFLLPSIPTARLLDTGEPAAREIAYEATAKTMVVLSHMAIILGMVTIGYLHFGNMNMGVAAALIYLMTPYTAQMTGRVEHALPAALLVWAVTLYRRPLLAGVCLGLSIGVVYYPVFLLPLWFSFYWRRGRVRFVLGLATALSAAAISLIFVSPDWEAYLTQLQQLYGLWWPARENLKGIWELGWEPIFRLPVLTAFVAMSVALAIWPAQKNLGTLLSCTAAVMVGVQFWHGYGGGIYIGWYLPLLALTIFRPNLEDRVALSVLSEGWFARKRLIPPPEEPAK